MLFNHLLSSQNFGSFLSRIVTWLLNPMHRFCCENFYVKTIDFLLYTIWLLAGKCHFTQWWGTCACDRCKSWLTEKVDIWYLHNLETHTTKIRLRYMDKRNSFGGDLSFGLCASSGRKISNFSVIFKLTWISTTCSNGIKLNFHSTKHFNKMWVLLTSKCYKLVVVAECF